MIDKPQVSLVIVSRGRPDDLKRVLTSLRFQTYPNFEVIVVADQDPKDTRVKFIKFDQANISTARNIGIENAAGSIVAFCDDDAIPEPKWLSRLVPAFDDPQVGIAGGFVRGRNGISFQWRGIETDQFGTDFPIKIAKPTTRGLANGRMLKVQGTNCAFRKKALTALGGFDQGFAFYLDETDIAWRLNQSGWKTRIIPLAEVQHGFAASEMRGSNRAPKSLKQIGSSVSLFLSKHANPSGHADTLALLRKAQRARLSNLLIWGQIEPREITRLMRSLESGLSSERASKTVDFNAAPAFRKFPNDETDRRLLHAKIWRLRSLMKQSKQMADQGVLVTAFCFSRTSRFHIRYFDARGFWVQRGGIFGKSDRSKSYFNQKLFSILECVKRERSDIFNQRPYTDAEVKNLH
jgi:cellulose synthase/poly-beta-1,6-N-acetylglucosamine synthase-like glycosyltransferase